MTLPPEVQAAVTRILDAEARRLLAEQLHTDPVSATPRHHDSTSNDRPDQSTAGIDGQPMPILRRVDRHSRKKAA